ncbi:hypothetical protein H8959_008536 [Pygathrix nigripes]
MTSVSTQLSLVLISLLLVLPVVEAVEAGDAIALLLGVVLSITGICACLGSSDTTHSFVGREDALFFLPDAGGSLMAAPPMPSTDTGDRLPCYHQVGVESRLPIWSSWVPRVEKEGSYYQLVRMKVPAPHPAFCYTTSVESLEHLQPGESGGLGTPLSLC